MREQVVRVCVCEPVLSMCSLHMERGTTQHANLHLCFHCDLHAGKKSERILILYFHDIKLQHATRCRLGGSGAGRAAVARSISKA